MILVDTSVIVAWLDGNHPHHRACVKTIEHWAQRERLAVSSVTYGELAAGGRTREAVEEDLRDFEKIRWIRRCHTWRAGCMSANIAARIPTIRCCRIFHPRPGGGVESSAPDEDRRRIKTFFPDVDFDLFGASSSLHVNFGIAAEVCDDDLSDWSAFRKFIRLSAGIFAYCAG